MAVINTNISATVTANSLTKNERVLEQTMERLSTGKRINSASDDAAGLAIASKMTSQINGLNQAARNANDAISMIQTADGAAIEITNMLQRMRELAVQATSDSYSPSDISNLNIEFAALADEIDRIVDATEWNGMAILDGSEGTGSNGVMSFQIGANDSQTVTVDFADFNMADGTGGISTVTAATAAVYASTIDIADYSTSDTLAVAGVTYTVTGSETDLSTLVTALNNSTATTATPYTFSASGSTLTMTADAGGAIASDPTAVGSIAITNTETNAGVAADAFAVYTSTIVISDYAASDTITVAGETYAVTGSEADLSTLVSALNLSTATTATPYTWSASGTTLTATADAAGAIASDPTLAGAAAVTTTTGSAGSSSAFAEYTSTIDVTAVDSGDVITTNGTAYTVTGSETQADLIAALNASTTTATALYTYSTTGTDIVMTADAQGTPAAGTTALAKAYTATEATAGSAEMAALYTSSIDVTDYATGDVITAAGTTYTVTGSETDNSALVTALNASTATSATGYTFASTGAGNLTMTQDTAGSVATAPTVAVVTADTVSETTAGTTSVSGTSASTGVYGVSLGGAMSSSGTINTATANILATLDVALSGLASQRATFGAAMNRLEYTVDNLMNVSQNTSASRSRIEDADYAAETTELARAQIISQAGTAMLAQANQQAQSVLTLLKG
jgi:flagellin